MQFEPSPILIKTRQGGIEVAVSGTGPAILLLHGAMGGYDQGLILGRAAVGWTGFQLIAISRPGYLGSPLTLGCTPREQAELCTDVLDALGIRLAAVMAISAGGQCALQFASRHTKRCWGLVMVSACSAQLGARLQVMFHMMKLMTHMPGLVAVTRSNARMDPNGSVAHAISNRDLRARTVRDPIAGPLLQALNLSTTDRMQQRIAGTQNDISQSRRCFHYPLEQIRVPTLIVHGTEDEIVPFAQAAALANRIPGSDLLAIPRGEHLSLFTHRQEISSHVTGFLNTHAPER